MGTKDRMGDGRSSCWLASCNTTHHDRVRLVIVSIELTIHPFTTFKYASGPLWVSIDIPHDIMFLE